ncbi:MAG: hypothetical protein JWO24_3215 [Rhodospirillales bacterium]|nr:hypothetical protein [Rhodospirillales bacterium]
MTVMPPWRAELPVRQRVVSPVEAGLPLHRSDARAFRRGTPFGSLDLTPIPYPKHPCKSDRG